MKSTVEKTLIHKLGLILIGFSWFFMLSCEKQQSNPLIGTWRGEQGNQKVELIISESGGQKNFTASHLFPNCSNGNWETRNNTLHLYYYPQVTALIDSLAYQQNTNGEPVIHLYESKSKQKFGELGNQNNINKLDSTVLHFNLDSDVLSINGNNQFWELMRTVPPAQNLSIQSVLRGILGIIFIIFIGWLFSQNRSKINWQLVGKGLILQIIIAIAVLKVPFIQQGFDFISKAFVKIISFTNEGINFLFAQFGFPEIQGPLTNFAFTILPTIIFFSALVSLFYYYGIIQKIIYAFAWVMKKFMRLSGAESLAAAGNVFLGQTESPLLVKPYLGKMTRSEIMCLMTGGMATIAGGVLAAYVGFLGGDDPVQQAFFAKHLLTASIISAPAAIIAAKMLVPETQSVNEDLKIDETKLGTNALEALSNGTTDGLKLAINVGAMLLVFIAIMALGNYILEFFGETIGLNAWIAKHTPYSKFSFEFILGYIGRPVVWLTGVSWVDSIYVGELLGTKTVLNEFVGYMRLGNMKADGLLSEKSTIISTYILCGFANFASIGIQIGGIGALIPSRKSLLSQLGVKALIGGTMACLMTAAIVGMMY